MGLALTLCAACSSPSTDEPTEADTDGAGGGLDGASDARPTAEDTNSSAEDTGTAGSSDTPQPGDLSGEEPPDARNVPSDTETPDAKVDVKVDVKDPSDAPDSDDPSDAASDVGGGQPTLDDPWTPATMAFKEDLCANEQCVEVHRLAQGGHLGGAQIVVVEVPGLDDAVSQWQRCVFSVMGCTEGGGAFAGCVAAADCPSPCKSAFAGKAAGKTLDEQLTAFEAVFVDEDAPCRASDSAEVTP